MTDKLSNISFYLIFLSSLVSVILNYAANIIYYIVYIFSIGLFMILIFVSKKNKFLTIDFLIILGLISIAFLLRYASYSDLEIQYIFVSFINIIVGYAIALNLKRINFKLLLYVSCFFIIIFILTIANDSLLLLGNTEYLNRTYYTLPVVLLLLITSYKDFVFFQKIDIYIVVIFLIVAILSFSRSSMLFPLIAVIIFMFSRQKLISIIIIIPIFIYLIVNIDFYQLNFLGDLITRIEERGLDSGRYEFWQEHLSHMTFYKFIVGYSFNDVYMTLANYFQDPESHTLHSSLLHIHIIYGIIGLFIFGLFFFRIFNVMFIVKQNFILNKIIFTLLIFTFLSKVLFETALFVQRYDFIFYAILFHSVLFSSKIKDLKYEKNSNSL